MTTQPHTLPAIGPDRCFLRGQNTSDITLPETISPEVAFTSSFELAPFPVCCYSSEGEFLFANQAFVSLLGYRDSAEIAANEWGRSFHHNPAEWFHFSRLCQQQQSFDDFRTRWNRHDGGTVPVRIAGRPYFGVSGQMRSILIFAMEPALQAEVASLRKICHDLNNALAVIRGHAELLALDSAPLAQNASRVPAILSAADSASAIVHNLHTLIPRLTPTSERA